MYDMICISALFGYIIRIEALENIIVGGTAAEALETRREKLY